MTKARKSQAKQFYKNYYNSYCYDIFDAYDRPSYRKVNAFEYCKDLMHQYNGHGLKITGFNTCTFSAAFVGVVEGVKHLFYITPSYDYIYPLEDLED